MPLSTVDKKKIIDSLIANEGVLCDNCGAWTEEDRAALNAIPEAKLVALNEARQLLANAQAAEPDEDEEDDEECTVEESAAVTKNSRNKTAAEWLQEAPAEIRSVVSNALKFEKSQKTKLIERITANERNKFTPQYLERQPLDVLEGLASLAANKREEEPDVLLQHYAGVPAITQNLGPDFAREDQDLIPAPFDWSQS